VTALVGAMLEATRLGLAGVTVLAVLGVALLVLSVRTESRSSDPMFTAALFVDREFTGSQAATVAYSAAFGILLVYLPQVSIGGSLLAGLALVPLTAPVLIVPPLATALARRFPPCAWFGGGLAIAAVGAALLATNASTGNPSRAMTSVALALAGTGFAACNAHLTNVAMRTAAGVQPALASALNFAARQASIAFGVAAANAALLAAPASSALPTLATVAGLISLGGAIAAAMLAPRTWLDRSPADQEEHGQ